MLHCSSNRALIVVVTLLSCCAAPALSGPLQFSDQSFDSSDYITVVTQGIGGQTWTQEADGGNSGTSPDPCRSVTTVLNLTTVTAHLHIAFIVDPAATPVAAIDFAIDAKAFAAFGEGMAYGFAAMQDGEIFMFGGTITGSSAASFQWSTHSIETTADALPGLDFSPSGSPIQFGFYTGNTGGAGITVGYDNFAVTVTGAGCPEDIDGDGDVDFADLNMLLGNFNTSGAGLAGDVDGDDDVDFADLNRVLGLFNTAC